MSGENKKINNIGYSCYYTTSREGENFVARHTLSFQIAGSLVLNDGSKDYPSKKGSLRLIRRNQLLKFTKQPAEHEPFRSLSLYLDQNILQELNQDYRIHVDKPSFQKPVAELKTDRLIETYVSSLLEHIETGYFDNQQLAGLKIKEGIILLIQANPDIKELLFDFSEPYKIDLNTFMNKNYHFNTTLSRMAYMTGRSLATFKRDFEKQFNTTPGRWILQKRLERARYLLVTERKKVSDIYLDLGFEDLSHFSFAFKKQFGVAPTRVHS